MTIANISKVDNGFKGLTIKRLMVVMSRCQGRQSIFYTNKGAGYFKGLPQIIFAHRLPWILFFVRYLPFFRYAGLGLFSWCFLSIFHVNAQPVWKHLHLKLPGNGVYINLSDAHVFTGSKHRPNYWNSFEIFGENAHFSFDPIEIGSFIRVYYDAKTGRFFEIPTQVWTQDTLFVELNPFDASPNLRFPHHPQMQLFWDTRQKVKQFRAEVDSIYLRHIFVDGGKKDLAPARRDYMNLMKRDIDQHYKRLLTMGMSPDYAFYFEGFTPNLKDNYSKNMLPLHQQMWSLFKSNNPIQEGSFYLYELLERFLYYQFNEMLDASAQERELQKAVDIIMQSKHLKKVHTQVYDYLEMSFKAADMDGMQAYLHNQYHEEHSCQRESSYKSSNVVSVGDVFPPIALQLFDAKGEFMPATSFPEFTQQVLSSSPHCEYVLFIFWSPTCTYCKELLPEMATFLKKYEIPVIAIGTSEEKDASLEAFMQTYPQWIHGLKNLPSDSSASESVIDAFNIQGTPTLKHQQGQALSVFDVLDIQGTPTFMLTDMSGKISLKTHSLKRVKSMLED
jgi:thiol-disulfide isomerase/thioredoxin